MQLGEKQTLERMMKTLFGLGLMTPFLLISVSVNASSNHGLAVLEYHQQENFRKKTALFSDRLREEFQREEAIAVLPKEETEEVFFYHRRSIVEGREEKIRTLLEQGKKNYFELKLADSERILRQAIMEGRNQGEEAYVDAHIVLALALSAEGRTDEAKEFFVEALRLDPTRQLDANFFPPKIIRLFDEVRGGQKGESKGALKIHSDPDGMEVFVNGTYHGVTPLTLSDFPSGNHVVRIEGSHYESQVRRVSLKEGGSQTLNVSVPWKMDESSERTLGFEQQEAQGVNHLARLVASSGWEMGVAKVLLVSYVRKGGKEFVETQTVDTQLKAVSEKQSFEAENLSKRSAEIARLVVDSLKKDLKGNMAIESEKVANRYAGDLLLVGRFRPLYKRPLFWAFIGAAGASGGVAAAVGGAVAATGAIVVVLP